MEAFNGNQVWPVEDYERWLRSCAGGEGSFEGQAELFEASSAMTHHDCRRFLVKDIPCPIKGMNLFGSELDAPVGFNHEFDDPEDEFPKMGSAERRESIKPSEVRIATMVSLESLLAQGMKPLPNVANGGLQWLMTVLSSQRMKAPFIEGQRRSPLISTERTQRLTDYEEAYAQESLRASKRFRGSKAADNGPNFFDSLIGNLVRAVALVGGTAATAYGINLARQAQTGGRFAPSRAGGTGRGAGGLTFQAPTFRPGIGPRRRRKGSTLSDSFDSFAEIGI